MLHVAREFFPCAHVSDTFLVAGDYDLSALASLIRDWSSESLLSGHSLATFLITENLNDLHPLIINNPRASRIKIALPSPDELTQAFEFMSPTYPCALKEYSGRLPIVAQQLAGSTLGAIERLLKTREHARQCLAEFHVRYNDLRPHWALVPEEGGDPLVPAEVYAGCRAIAIPRWQEWACAARSRLEKLLAVA